MKAFDSITRLLHDEYGFDASRPGMESLHRIVSERCAATGKASAEEYFFLLENSPDERNLLIDAIVVSETFFFRYPESFATLAEWAKGREHFPLRILSAACSTGEETYSIAMCLLDAGFTPEQLLIEGCDASAASIAEARHGIYRRKAFRSGEQTWQSRYFSETPEGWTISPQLRGMVRFRQDNLLTLDDSHRWDVIFCRNALIYFTPAQQQKVAERLERILVDDGLLFLGPAEPPVFLANGWSSSGYSMSFSLLRQPGKTPPPPLLRSVTPTRKPRVKQKLSVAPLPKPVVAAAPAVELSLLERAEDLADHGRLDEAESVLQELLKSDAGNISAHFLCGLIAEVQGRESIAESYYRRTLYLAPHHADALQHMALLLKGQGRLQAADNLNRRAARHTTPS